MVGYDGRTGASHPSSEASLDVSITLCCSHNAALQTEQSTHCIPASSQALLKCPFFARWLEFQSDGSPLGQTFMDQEGTSVPPNRAPGTVGRGLPGKPATTRKPLPVELPAGVSVRGFVSALEHLHGKPSSYVLDPGNVLEVLGAAGESMMAQPHAGVGFQLTPHK